METKNPIADVSLTDASRLPTQQAKDTAETLTELAGLNVVGRSDTLVESNQGGQGATAAGSEPTVYQTPTTSSPIVWATILFAFHTEIWKLIDMDSETESVPTTTFTACGLYIVHHANQEWIQAVLNQGFFTFHDGNETFHLSIRTPPQDWTERKVKRNQNQD
ncbi:hypothetical protein TRICI_006580 [Trichomonascus ciferrii]|uniref:Uncharacterized protein n=1 Tax=Trichomonascus ciferrii TaxID=44093 RepID=A0A642UG96_9ASCO|nr:hypothetical protein TRICI_006580 [Trichomonascus ciferrii]